MLKVGDRVRHRLGLGVALQPFLHFCNGGTDIITDIRDGHAYFATTGGWLIKRFELVEPAKPKAVVRVGDYVKLASWKDYAKVIGEDMGYWIIGDKHGGNTFYKTLDWIVKEQPKLDLTKPVQTKDGKPVRTLCTNGPHPTHTVVGFVEGSPWVLIWTPEGKGCVDLVNVPPEPVSVTKYWYLLRNRTTGKITAHIDGPNFLSSPVREIIARKEVTITEGEGV